MQYLGDNNINLFLEFLKKNRHQMKPCTSDEIEQLKALAKNRYLPDAYLNFMRHAGNGIRFFRGSSYTMNEIHKLQEWANELLHENESIEILTDNNFVFFMHQGYQFYFFNLNESDNPPIYYYGEGENLEKFRKKHESFSEFLINYYNEVEPILSKGG